MRALALLLLFAVSAQAAHVPLGVSAPALVSIHPDAETQMLIDITNEDAFPLRVTMDLEVPAAWTVSVEPSVIELMPAETKSVTLTILSPPSGTGEIVLHATSFLALPGEEPAQLDQQSHAISATVVPVPENAPPPVLWPWILGALLMAAIIVYATLIRKGITVRPANDKPDVMEGSIAILPLKLRNFSRKAATVQIQAHTPEGWRLQVRPHPVRIGPRGVGEAEIQVFVPRGSRSTPVDVTCDGPQGGAQTRIVLHPHAPYRASGSTEAEITDDGNGKV